jgi:hypothetical protein
MQGAQTLGSKPDCNEKPTAQRGLVMESGTANRQEPQAIPFLGRFCFAAPSGSRLRYTPPEMTIFRQDTQKKPLQILKWNGFQEFNLII